LDPSTQPSERLVRDIHRWDIVAIVINGTVGAGIFGLPSTVYQHVGAYSILALIACSLLIGLVVLCFAELSSRFDRTGGPYLYALEAFGPFVGFQIGWLMWLQRLTAFAAICNLMVIYLGYLWPGSNSTVWRALIVTSVTISLTLANIRHVRETAIVNDIFTIGKLVPLLFFIGSVSSISNSIIIHLRTFHEQMTSRPQCYCSFSSLPDLM